MARPKRRMLIVDDDPNEALFLADAFRSSPEPVEIRHAESGEEGLEAIGSFDPDLILLDLNMPGMDGFDVLAAIKGSEAMKVLPTLIFSSSERDIDIERSYRGHANAYVVKPRTFDGYRKLAEDIERFWYETARV